MKSLSALWRSFLPASVSFEAFSKWNGICALPLVVLAAIHTVIVCWALQSHLQNWIHEWAPQIVSQIPTITFKDGQASTPEAKSYEITVPDSDHVIAIVDTRRPDAPVDLGGARIFIAGKSLTSKNSNMEERTYRYGALNLVLDESLINSWLGFVGNWTMVFCLPFIFGYLVIWRLLQLLFFSLVTLLAARIFSLTGSYAAKLRITGLALIPAIIFALIVHTCSFSLPGFPWIFSAIVVGYIILGLRATSLAKAVGSLETDS